MSDVFEDYIFLWPWASDPQFVQPALPLDVEIKPNIFSIQEELYLKKKIIKLYVNLFSQYGQQFKEDLDISDIVDFITDYYAIRYVSRKSAVPSLDTINIITSISNLLRECERNNINEVFLGSIRLKKTKDKKYWVLVER